MIPPRQVRMDTLTTTKKELALDALLADDSTFYGDLFPHAVQWHGELYLEDGLHRALRAALQQRNVIHVRVLDLDALTPGAGAVRAGDRVDPGAAPPGPAQLRRRLSPVGDGVRRAAVQATQRPGERAQLQPLLRDGGTTRSQLP